jgi:hypothetical protein
VKYNINISEIDSNDYRKIIAKVCNNEPRCYVNNESTKIIYEDIDSKGVIKPKKIVINLKNKKQIIFKDNLDETDVINYSNYIHEGDIYLSPYTLIKIERHEYVSYILVNKNTGYIDTLCNNCEIYLNSQGNYFLMIDYFDKIEEEYLEGYYYLPKRLKIFIFDEGTLYDIFNINQINYIFSYIKWIDDKTFILKLKPINMNKNNVGIKDSLYWLVSIDSVSVEKNINKRISEKLY